MHFFFSCKHCGEYVTNRQSLEAFLIPELVVDLDARILKGDVAKVILEFIGEDGDCPSCKPRKERPVQLSVISALAVSEC